MYEYNAEVLRVIDGDTAEVLVDLGFRIAVKVTLRLFGIDTPEIRGSNKEAGIKSRTRLRELVEGKTVRIKSTELDKYGRTVAIIYLENKNVNELLVYEGLAVPYDPKD